MPIKQLFPVVLWGIGGGIATRAVPEMFMSSYNTGVIGYVMNAVVAFGGSLAIGKFAGSNAASGWLIGGATALVSRIVSDVFGQTLVTYSNVPGLSGDPSFNFHGYDPYQFVLPTTDDGQMVLGPGAVPTTAVSAGKAATSPAAASPLALNPASGGGTMPREWAA